jgi:ABC-type transporter Mla maintaining outer membrane lipid asymmetry ATPase subunit MlaF
MVITDGTYVATFGKGLSSTGTVTVTDGKIAVVRTGGSGAGGSTLTVTSTALMEERDGRRVLVGQGRNDLGPFSYELAEQK